MIPRLTCRNVTRYTRNFTLTLTHMTFTIVQFYIRSFFGREDWIAPLPVRSLLLLARPHTNSLNQTDKRFASPCHESESVRYPYPSGARLDIVTCTSKL